MLLETLSNIGVERAMIAFRCPECDAELEVADSHAGARIKCPDCGHRSSVPNRSRPAARQEAERASRSSSTGRAKERPERPRRETPPPKSRSNATAIIIASVAGGTVLCAALIIGLIVLFRSNSDTVNNNPPQDLVARSAPQPPVKPVDAPAAPKPSKPAEESNVEPAATGATAVNSNVIFQHLVKSVALVVSHADSDPSDKGSLGSGTLVDQDNRLVLTNAHVVRGENLQILVLFPQRKSDGSLLDDLDTYLKLVRGEGIRAKVLAREARCDLALLQLDRVPDGIEALALANQPAATGNDVHSVGNPGAILWVYTHGNVRKGPHHLKWHGGDQQHGMEHDATVILTSSATNPGDSGGPLVNDRGELVAVTQGYMGGNARLLSLFIDVSEAKAFVENTCRQTGLLWNRANRVIVAGNAAGVPGLIRNLESKDPRVRTSAVQGLGNARSDARMAIRPLLDLLKNEQEDLLRRLTLDALKQIGKPDRGDLDALKEALNDSHPEVRGYAVGAIGLLGVDGQSALPDLLKLARAPEVVVRQNAIRALGRMGPEYKEKVMPLIASGLKDSDRDVRLAAGEAVASMGSFGKEDIPVLMEILKNSDPQIQAFAATALGKMGSVARPAAAALANAFKDSTDRGLRRAVVEALATIGKSAKTSVPVYAEALHESDKEMRKTALEAVIRLGADAEEAAGAVGDLLNDPDKGVSLSAARALKKLGPAAKKALPAMREALKEEDRDLRLEVLAALGAMGPEAKPAIKEMLKVFEGDRRFSERKVHERCAQALASIGKDAVKPLMLALKNENNMIRVGAAMALGEMGPGALGSATRSVRELLAVHATGDVDPQVQEACTTALAKLAVK
jgi:HEAT repeat protein/S1-C subfamily serine protease/DNA-directed RNA polymerase subunit RPC12/RpoP